MKIYGDQGSFGQRLAAKRQPLGRSIINPSGAPIFGGGGSFTAINSTSAFGATYVRRSAGSASTDQLNDRAPGREKNAN